MTDSNPQVVKEIIREVPAQQETFDFWRFLQGFFPTSGKSTGKLLHIVLMVCIGLFLYNKFIVSPVLTNEYSSNLNNAANVTFNQQTVVEDDRNLFFGLQIAKVKFGLTYVRAKIQMGGAK